MALLAWHVAESVAISPNYLAYFNQLAGGPRRATNIWPTVRSTGDRTSRHSNNGSTARDCAPGAGNVYLSYFGTARPEYYGVQATASPGFIDRRPPQQPVPLGGGVYCISATVLDVLGNMFYKPEYERNYQAALENMTPLLARRRARRHGQR